MEKILVIMACLALAGFASASTISVNFHVGDDNDLQADHELTGSEAAGLDNNTTWNNINVGNGAAHNTAGAIFGSTVLTDDAGDTSAATIAPSVNSTWFVGYAASAASANGELNLAGTNHDDLFNSYLALNGPSGDGTPADAAVLNISGLGSAYTSLGYKLIIYSDSDRRNTGTNPRRSEFTVTPSGGSAVTVFVEDDDKATPVNIFDGTYIMSDNSDTGADYSNYTVVSGLTADSFSLEVTSPDGGRGAISGFQIVAIPEPATLGMVVATGVGVLFIRRRFMI